MSLLCTLIFLLGIGWFIVNQQPSLARKLFPQAHPVDEKTKRKEPAMKPSRSSMPDTGVPAMISADFSRRETDTSRRTTAITPIEPVVRRPIPHEADLAVQKRPIRPMVVSAGKPPFIPDPSGVKKNHREPEAKPAAITQPLPFSKGEPLSLGVEKKTDSVPAVKPLPLKKPAISIDGRKAPIVFDETTPEMIAGVPSLRLQALVWSDDPEKRLAVINDVILKIGRYVQGFHVAHIERDYVIVQKGSKKVRLKFSLK